MKKVGCELVEKRQSKNPMGKPTGQRNGLVKAAELGLITCEIWAALLLENGFYELEATQKSRMAWDLFFRVPIWSPSP